MFAPLAQLVEQLTCNEQVVGSSPTGSSRVAFTLKFGLANQRRKAMQTLNFMAECPLNGVRHCDEVGLKYPLSYEIRLKYKRSQVGRWIKQREVWHRRTLWEDSLVLNIGCKKLVNPIFIKILGRRTWREGWKKSWLVVMMLKILLRRRREYIICSSNISGGYRVLPNLQKLVHTNCS